MDRISSEARSSLMSKVKACHTRPEIAVRRLAHSLGYRFRLHRSDLPGTPDIAFHSRQCAVFVNGCFWHQHPGCRKGTIPTTRHEFWAAKLARNVARDAEAVAVLESQGWRVLTVWECETRDIERLTVRLSRFLDTRTAS